MHSTMTLERHIMTAQRDFPDATGILTALLYDLALAAKVIHREATRKNIREWMEREPRHEPRAARLAEFADATLIQLCQRAGRVGGIATRHDQRVVSVGDNGGGKYILVLDPLEGASRTDYTVSMGTIFGVYRRQTSGVAVTEADCLQPGRRLVTAGYILYGSSTMMVYSSGRGVNGFTLDLGLGEFLLSHAAIRIPSPPLFYSLNHARDDFWTPGMRRYARYLQGKDSAFPGGLSLRYTGSLVADFHRNLLAGGVLCYPADTMYPTGEVFLTFEANPLAFLAEQAGGAASDGVHPILDSEPAALHQRTSLLLGSKELVEMGERFYRLYDEGTVMGRQ